MTLSPNELDLGPQDESCPRCGATDPEQPCGAPDPLAWDAFDAIPTMGYDVRSLAREAGLDRNGWTYDTALPLLWCNSATETTGLAPYGLGIVWAYGPSGSGYWMGDAFALTPAGKVYLSILKHIASSR